MADPDPTTTGASTRGTTTTEESTRGTTTLFNDVFAQVSALIRNEVDLARTEVQDSISKAVAAIGLLVGAVVLVLSALNVLAAALVAWLTELGLATGWASLIVGGVLAIIALILLKKGQNDLKASSLAPTRTAHNVRRDAHAVKETTNHAR